MRSAPPPRQGQIVTILFMTAMLVFLLVTRRHCAEGTAGFFRGFERAGDGGAAR